MGKELMYQFKTRNFTILAVMRDDDDYEPSDREEAEKLASGEWYAFGTRVSVEYKGVTIGADDLWGSVYADPREFFTAHRDPDPMNRNCEAYRKARGQNSCICHYFPDMVRIAIRAARSHAANISHLRKDAA